ncbi:hypothetical protein QFZ51_005203 [Chitinophaga sp. W3I9]
MIEQMWILMIENGIAKRNDSFNITAIKQAINRYDLLWSEWRALNYSSVMGLSFLLKSNHITLSCAADFRYKIFL